KRVLPRKSAKIGKEDVGHNLATSYWLLAKEEAGLAGSQKPAASGQQLAHNFPCRQARLSTCTSVSACSWRRPSKLFESVAATEKLICTLLPAFESPSIICDRPDERLDGSTISFLWTNASESSGTIPPAEKALSASNPRILP